jgi:uncharacterized protein (DUF58 family)
VVKGLLSPFLIARLDRLDVLSRKILVGKLRGERRGRGHATQAIAEPAGYRDYAPGDDPRFIDWNIYGRLDRLLVKLFVDEQDLFVHILLDVSKSCDWGEPNKLLYLKQLAAALGYVAMVNNHWLTISAIADGVAGQSGLLRGRGRVGEMIEFVGNRQAEGLTRFDQACRRFAMVRPRQGVCIVLSDFLFGKGLDEGLRRLEAGRHDLFCLQVLSPQELNPPLSGEHRLVDVETGADAELGVTPEVVQEYRKNLREHCQAVGQRVTRGGGIYLQTNTAYPVDRLVLDCLRNAGVLV